MIIFEVITTDPDLFWTYDKLVNEEYSKFTCPARYVLSSGDCALSRMEPGKAIEIEQWTPTIINKKKFCEKQNFELKF